MRLFATAVIALVVSSASFADCSVKVKNIAPFDGEQELYETILADKGYTISEKADLLFVYKGESSLTRPQYGQYKHKATAALITMDNTGMVKEVVYQNVKTYQGRDYNYIPYDRTIKSVMKHLPECR